MQGTISTADVLKRTALELDSLGIATRALEKTVTEMFNDTSDASPALSLQGFDVVSQTLSALTAFIEEVGDQICASHQTDIERATHSIKLGDLRARLLQIEPMGAASGPPEVF